MRPAGQIVLRSETAEHVAEWLSIVRLQLPTLFATELTASNTIEQPSMHIGMSVDMDAYARVLAKIGMNIAIHIYGAEFCRIASFDNIKAAIVLRKPAVPMGLDGEHGTNFSALFSAIGSDCHVMMLAAHRHSSERHSILFVVRLFGGPIHVIRLTQEDAPAPPVADPVFLTVDYVNHVVEQLGPLELVRKMTGRVPDGPDFEAQA